MKWKLLIKLLIISAGVFMAGCATYYMKTLEFQQYVNQGNFEKADKWLASDNRGKSGKNQLLHYLNRGYVSWVLQEPAESNYYFQIAENLIEDYIKNYYLDALTLVSNPGIKPYKPEDFEAVMVNYFMALNFIRQGKYNEAIVECKRINIKLNQLNDRYKDHKNRYQRDAFAHALMGMIYEANHDYNNAFIAYRNALEVYERDYASYFDIEVPGQIKKDVLRTAYLTGFRDEVEYYERKFGMRYEHKPSENGELVFLWMNGFGPVKAENSINFTKVPNSRHGYLTLVNEEYDLSFPIYIGNKNNKEKTAFEELRFFRVAFPKYVERKPVFKSADIQTSSGIYEVEMLQNINDIAFKTLKDRMLREMASSIARLATKKALEMIADEQDESLGTLINIVNTVTEKADTRNWQTLPYSISYARIPLKKGSNTITLITRSNKGMRKHSFHFEGKEGHTYFHAYHTIASQEPNIRY